ncbi:hypothetical protein D3C76_813100 [compost metagenome]
MIEYSLLLQTAAFPALMEGKAVLRNTGRQGKTFRDRDGDRRTTLGCDRLTSDQIQPLQVAAFHNPDRQFGQVVAPPSELWRLLLEVRQHLGSLQHRGAMREHFVLLPLEHLSRGLESRANHKMGVLIAPPDLVG